MRQTGSLTAHNRFRPTRAMRARAKNFTNFVLESLVRAGVRGPVLLQNEALMSVYYAFEARERERAATPAGANLRGAVAAYR